MPNSTGDNFEDMLTNFVPSIQNLAREARALIFTTLPQVVEVVWVKQRIAGYGTGPKKQSEHFSWIAPYKKHVVLGFNYGSELPDPEYLLEGTGKLFRHVKLTSSQDLQNPALQALLAVAVRHRVPPPKLLT